LLDRNFKLLRNLGSDQEMTRRELVDGAELLAEAEEIFGNLLRWQVKASFTIENPNPCDTLG
jgi:hypothetical protein